MLFYVLFVSIVLFYVLFVSIVLFYVLSVCKCVVYYCHRVATQLLLNISYIIKVMVFWDVKPCHLMNIFGNLGGTCFLQLQGDPCHASSDSFCIPVVTCIFSYYLMPISPGFLGPLLFYWNFQLGVFWYARSYFGLFLFNWFWLSYLWVVYSTRTRFYPDWDIFHVPASMSQDVPHWNFFDASVRLIQL